MYRFLLSPRWLVAHVAVALIVVVCVTAGLWQLRRHDERRTFNTLIAERADVPPAPLEGLMDGGDHDDIVFRRAVVRGTFDTDNEILLAGRTHQGRPGHHLLTPLVVDLDRAVLVDRGWVPFELDDPPVTEALPPERPVTVTGYVLLSDPGGRAEPRDGRVRATTRVNIEGLAEHLPYALYPVWLLLEDQDPPQVGDHPVAAGLPEPDAGPHLSYGVQWFLFALIGSIVYGVIVRKEAQKRKGVPENV